MEHWFNLLKYWNIGASGPHRSQDSPAQHSCTTLGGRWNTNHTSVSENYKVCNTKSVSYVSSPVPVKPSVIVPVEKVRLRPESAHIWMYPDELQHRPGASFLYTHYERVRQLLIPIFLRDAHVSQLRVGPVAPSRGGGSTLVAGIARPSLGGGALQRGPDFQRRAIVQFSKKFLPSRVLARRAPLPLITPACHDCAATEENTVAQIGAGQWHGEYEGESGAESVRRWEEPMCHVSMGSKRCMVFHRSPPPPLSVRGQATI